jgi:hypothetical protein
MSKARSCFYPWERFTTEMANSIELARCNMSSELFCPIGGKAAMRVGHA